MHPFKKDLFREAFLASILEACMQILFVLAVHLDGETAPLLFHVAAPKNSYSGVWRPVAGEYKYHSCGFHALL